MEQDSDGLAQYQPTPAQDRGMQPGRRHMLRRSLGAAAPVLLTLGSAPVAAGQCISASGFVSAAAFHSRPEFLGVISCAGLAPGDWVQRAPYWPGDVKPKTRFHKEFGSKAITPGLAESTSLLEALQAPSTIEAHVTAALLNAHRGGMAPPFDTPVNVMAIWANIRANGGFFKPGTADSQLRGMTAQGTLQWIAMTWTP